jgi:hypothetical protein
MKGSLAGRHRVFRVKEVLGARVPIVRFRHIPSAIIGDISGPPQTLNPKPDVRNLKPETRNLKPKPEP